MKSKNIAAALISSCLLAACGGGGDGSPSDAVSRVNQGSPAPTPPATALTHPFPMAAIMASLATGTVGASVKSEFTATGSDASAYRLTVIRETGPDVTFNNVTATPTVVTEVLRKNGVDVYHSSRIEYVEPSPSFKALGTQGNATQAYIVTRAPTSLGLPYPVTAKVNDVGSLPYGDVSLNSIVGREGHFWEVKAGGTADTAQLCEIIEGSPEVANSDVYSTYPRTYCHTVDTTDTVIGDTITLSYQGEALLFQ